MEIILLSKMNQKTPPLNAWNRVPSPKPDPTPEELKEIYKKKQAAKDAQKKAITDYQNKINEWKKNQKK